jgi:DNA repair protein RecO (recombination protein O)
MRDSGFQLAYVLHTRAYRNTSLLVELFTQEAGRLTVVARGAKRPKSPWAGLLQPFMPISVSYVGKHDLKALREVELAGGIIQLAEMRLWCGLYVNELLMKVIHQHDPHPELFMVYQALLKTLGGASELEQEQLLRRFERELLKLLGYELQIHRDSADNEVIQSDAYYHYLPEFGLRRVARYESDSAMIFPGKHLLAIDADHLDDPLVLRDAKKLLRLALSPLLNHKMLQTSLMLSKKFEVLDD